MRAKKPPGTQIFCACEGPFSPGLTYGKGYPLIATQPGLLFGEAYEIIDNLQQKRAYSAHYFTEDRRTLAILKELHLDLDEPLHEDAPLEYAVEYSVELEGQQGRWGWVTSPSILANSGDLLAQSRARVHFGMGHMLVVSRLTKSTAREAIMYAYRQGELLHSTRPWGS